MTASKAYPIGIIAAVFMIVVYFIEMYQWSIAEEQYSLKWERVGDINKWA